ncbi:histidine kinase dimerization/phospho-acceptor domain-containing protein [Actinomadura viridis]|uniref:histidine kinase dimerization/phospho-acceptor domain-containing protein n=1 Tax=Actinomadura viridis TaxID=58110 RepID=UPI0036CD4572
MIELHPGACRRDEAPAREIGAGGRERVPTEEQLAEGQRRFIVQTAHELRTPLAALRLELEEALLHRDTADPYAALKKALHSAERLENTVIALLSSQTLGERRRQAPLHGE